MGIWLTAAKRGVTHLDLQHLRQPLIKQGQRGSGLRPFSSINILQRQVGGFNGQAPRHLTLKYPGSLATFINPSGNLIAEQTLQQRGVIVQASLKSAT